MPPPSITSLFPTSAAAGSQVTITGANFGAAQGDSTVTFNGVSSGVAANWSDTSITVIVPSGAGTGNVVVTVAAQSSAGTPFTVLVPPAITSIWPASGPTGTSVTITGTGFGASQGTSTVAFGGVPAATIPYWSATSITAIVPGGAVTGSVVVTVNGMTGTGDLFTVTNPPHVDSVSPDRGAPGRTITISGTGFGPQQGIGQVWLGSTYGIVASWSDTQIAATVAPDSRSGTAKVLQSGVWSNAVNFDVDTVTISDVSPNNGPPGTVVTITGSSFGALQGSGTVQLGSIAGIVQDWSETQITATVAAGSVSGIARVQQNGILSNAVAFTVPVSSGAVTMAPNLINMVVGDTRAMQALDSSSRPVTGLNWISSDPTVVSVSPDEPIVLTALAPGHVTVTAGGASADVTVYATALPTGTTIWSNPGNGSGVYSIVPAVPSPSGVADVFAFQNDGTVQAITADGLTAWTADVHHSGIPDFQGGLIVIGTDQTNRPYVSRLDGMTGQPVMTYSSEGLLLSKDTVLVHTDGTIIALEQTLCCATSVIGIDPNTGARKFSIPLDGDIVEGNEPTGRLSLYPEPHLIIAGDGYVYVTWAYGEIWVDSNFHSWANTHVMVLRVGTSGAYDKFRVYDFEQDSPDWPRMSGRYLITDADNGVVLSWETEEVPDFAPRYHMARITSDGVNMVGAPQVPGQDSDSVKPVLQLQDGAFVGTAGRWADTSSVMVAFDATGTVRWTVPGYDPKIATADGGVIATDESGTAAMFDQNGNATGQQIGSLIYSWTGNSYQVGSVDLVSTGLVLEFADSFWAFAQGNLSGTLTSDRPIARDVRRLIAQIARNYVGSQNWLDTNSGNMCNIFVKDVLKEAGMTPPVSPALASARWRWAYYLGLVDTPAYPAQSRDWANPGTDLKCWRPLTTAPSVLPADLSGPGDVIAEAINYSDAFGHVGIVVGSQQTASADSVAPCVIGKPAGTIDISDYGFRPANWVDPIPCSPPRIHGKKKDAVVKRFVCQ
jgi:hypothetical protein